MSRSLSMSDRLDIQRARAGTPLGDGLPTTMLWTLGVRALIFCVGVLSIMTAAGRLNVEAASGHPWVAYDAEWYLHILLNGYPKTTADPNIFVIAYFPLFPFAARLLTTWLTPIHAMVVLANACAIVGFGFLYAWLRNLTTPRTAMIAVMLLATYPGAVFFSAGLTEAPFFMLVAVTLWLLQKKRLWLAACACAVATITRPTGVALAVTVFAYAFVHYGGLPWVQRIGRSMLVGLVASSGGLAYGAFLWHRYETPTAYVYAQSFWERGEKVSQMRQEQAGIKRWSAEWFMDRAQRPQAWNRIMAAGVLALIVAGFIRPHGIPRVLFILPLLIFLLTAIPNWGLRASSIYRYETAALPVFALLAILLSRADRRPVLLALLCGMFAVQTYYAVLFSRGTWIG